MATQWPKVEPEGDVIGLHKFSWFWYLLTCAEGTTGARGNQVARSGVVPAVQYDPRVLIVGISR